MALTEVYVDPSIDADSGTGTIGDPYGDLQYALDTETRDSTNGNRFNIKAGTAEVLSASLDLTTYGTPSSTAPLVFQGYTSSAGDGGMGEIDLNAGAYNMLANGLYRHFRDLEVHNGTGTELLKISSGQSAIGCYVHNGSTDGILASNAFVIGCRIENCGRYGINAAAIAAFCYLENGTNKFTAAIYNTTVTYKNFISVDGSSNGIHIINYDVCIANSIYSAGGTGKAFNQASHSNWFIDNLGEGFSGSGGHFLDAAAGNTILLNNWYYDCDTGVDSPSTPINEGTVSLGSSPFSKSGSLNYSNRNSWFDTVSSIRGQGFTFHKGDDASSLTETYVDPSINANSGTGTVGDPYGDLQYAMDTMTRDSTNGDRINVKSGAAEVLSADLSFTSYGTPNTTAPLVFQGYDVSAGDGGVGEIDLNVSYDIPVKAYTHYVDLEIHNSTQTTALAAHSTAQSVFRCYLHDVETAISLSGVVAGCRFEEVDTYCVTNGGVVFRNWANHSSGDSQLPTSVFLRVANAIENIMSLTGSVKGVEMQNYDSAINNSALSDSASSTGTGIYSQSHSNFIMNNLAEGFDGTGGEGIHLDAGNDCVINNSTYDCDVGIRFDDDSPPFNSGNEDLVSSLFLKSGANTYANRGPYFGPADVGSVRGGGFS